MESDALDSTDWTHDEVQTLICVWGEKEIQVELEASTPNQTVYLEIAHRLSALGVERTAQQCREKIQKLKQDYKKAKEEQNNGGKSGAADRTTSEAWFDALDAVLGPRNVVESSTAMLQAITDVNIRKIVKPGRIKETSTHLLIL